MGKLFFVDGPTIIKEHTMPASLELRDPKNTEVFYLMMRDPAIFRSETSTGHVLLQDTHLIFYQNTTAEAAHSLVYAYMNPPAIVRHFVQMDVNRAIRHEIIEISDAKQDEAIRRAYRLAQWLYSYSVDTGDWNGETLANTVPKELLEFELPSDGWDLLARELRRHKTKYNPRDNPLYSMQSVLGEQLGFVGYTLRQKRVHSNYLSLLRYRLHPAEPVLMAITAEVDSLAAATCNQIYIVAYPTLWMLRVMTKCCPETKNVSMLMHSITAYAMRQLHPQLNAISIHDPTTHMQQKLETAAKKHRFKIEDPDSPTLRISMQPSFLWMWKSEWAEPDMIIESGLK